MTLRWFAYYCGVCGAWCALLGWLAGTLLSPAGGQADDDLARASVLGLALGFFVALGLTVLDASWNASGRGAALVLRVLIALALGSAGGFVGAFAGQALYGRTQQAVFFLLGWTVVGLLVGASVGAFDTLAGIVRGRVPATARRKLRHCLIGGVAGGFAGGLVALLLRSAAASVFADKDQSRLLSPTALGFVAVGAGVGLFIGLAQVLLKEAWVKVEAGFRPGREMILSRERVSIGRSEGSDVALFGDAGVEKIHAYIVRRDGGYLLEEFGPGAGTFVNERRIHGSHPLASGDRIRVGQSVLLFSERPRSPV